jgi:hypothetical protein
LLGWTLVDSKGAWHGKVTGYIEHKRRNNSEIVAGKLSATISAADT